MAKTRLTSGVLSGAQYEGDSNNCFIWDDEIHGFAARVYPSGRVAFFLDYRTSSGRRRRMKLGDYPVITCQQARDLAKLRLGQVYAGRDPIEEKREARHKMTMAEYCAKYIDEYAKPRKQSWKDDESRIRQYIIPAFGSRHVDSVSRPEIAAFHNRLGKKSIVVANRCLAQLQHMFNVARVWGILPENLPNPAKNIQRLPEESRERYLTEDEAARLLAAVDAEQDLRLRSLIRLYLYTGCRKEELLGLEWENVDFSTGRLIKRRTKAGRIHYIKPDAEAWKILRRLNEIRDMDNPHVFPGARPGTHLNDVKRPWQRIRENAGLRDVTLHDLRRTVGSWMAQSDVNTAAIQKVLDHSQLSATQVYARMSGSDTEGPLKKIGEIMKRVEKKAAGGPGVVRLDDHRRSEKSIDLDSAERAGDR